jgi:anti-sigma factor RsiW
MEHAEAQEQFSAYHDGELPAADNAKLAEHLAGCAECRAEYEKFRAALVALRTLASLRQAAPQDFVGAVEGQIRKRSRGRFFTRPAPRLGQWTLSVISLVTLIVTVLIYYFAALSSQ